VTRCLDKGVDELLAAVSAFTTELGKGGTGVFYFAGAGGWDAGARLPVIIPYGRLPVSPVSREPRLRRTRAAARPPRIPRPAPPADAFLPGRGACEDGKNFLLAAGALPAEEASLERSSLPVDLLLQRLAACNARLALVLLDACHPLSPALALSHPRLARGMAKPAPPPAGIALALAAQPGAFSLSGGGGRSFTGQLIARLATRSAGADVVLHMVAASVSRSSRGAQQPLVAHALRPPCELLQPPAAESPPAPDLELRAIADAMCCPSEDPGRLVAHMQAHAGLAAVQEAACHALRVMSVAAASRRLAGAAGAHAAVASAMRAHAGSERVCVQACMALRNLTSSEENKVLAGREGVFGAVVAAMRAHAASEAVAEHGCAALINCATHEGNLGLLGAAGGVEAVLGAMRAHPACEAVQDKACWALRNMVVHDANCRAAGAAGALEAVTAALRALPASLSVAEQAGKALINLTGLTGSAALAGAAGAVEALVDCMAAHPASAGVQTKACRALFNMTAGSEVNRRRAAARGALNAVAACLSAHAADPEACERACLVLRCVVTDASEGAAVRAALTAVAAAMRTHAAAPAVLEQALWTLRTLSLFPSLRDLVACSDALPATLEAMRVPPAQACVAEHGCAALCLMAASSDESKMRANEGGAVEAVLGALRAHPSALGVQEHGCACLRLLTSGKRSRGRAGAGGGAELLVAALRAHAGSRLLVKEACLALLNVISLPAYRAKAGAAGAAAALAGAMRAHTARLTLQEACCVALFRLADGDEENAARCGAAGALECVAAALRAHPASEGLAELGCDMLRVLCAAAKLRALALEAGCAEAAVGCLRAHPRSAKVAEAACLALAAMVKGPPALLERLRRAGALEELEAVVQHFAGQPALVSRAKEAQARLKPNRYFCMPARRLPESERRLWDVEMGASGEASAVVILR